MKKIILFALAVLLAVSVGFTDSKAWSILPWFGAHSESADLGKLLCKPEYFDVELISKYSWWEQSYMKEENKWFYDRGFDILLIGLSDKTIPSYDKSIQIISLTGFGRFANEEFMKKADREGKFDLSVLKFHGGLVPFILTEDWDFRYSCCGGAMIYFNVMGYFKIAYYLQSYQIFQLKLRLPVKINKHVSVAPSFEVFQIIPDKKETITSYRLGFKIRVTP